MEVVGGAFRLPTSRAIGATFLVLSLAVGVLAFRESLTSAWYQSLGYVHLTRALLSPQSRGEELGEAEGLFLEALKWQDDKSRAHWGLGLVHYQLGDQSAAVEEWRRSDAALSRLLAGSAVAYQDDEYAEAQNQALLALEVDPNSSSAHYRLGEAYRALGQLDCALIEYGKAKELNSFLSGDTADLASCYFGMARAYAAEDNWEAARWQYEVGLQMRSDAQAYASLSDIYRYQLRDLPTAAGYLEQAIALDPNQAWWHISLGEIYLNQEKYGHALFELQTAIQLGDRVTEITDVHVGLGRAYYGLGQFENAVQAYQEALVLDPDNGSAREGLEEALKSLHSE